MENLPGLSHQSWLGTVTYLLFRLVRNYSRDLTEIESLFLIRDLKTR